MDNNEPEYLNYIFEFFKTIKLHNIKLVYEGEITDELTQTFSSMAENNMIDEGSGVVHKRVFHIMVECLQNISRHGEESIQEEKLYSTQGIFIVCKDKNQYQIITGNNIENSKIDLLKSKLEQVNGLSKEQLNDLYKQQLRDGELSKKGGAGLGFIDIARKSGKKIEYFFHPIDETMSFFIMSSTIPRN